MGKSKIFPKVILKIFAQYHSVEVLKKTLTEIRIFSMGYELQ